MTHAELFKPEWVQVALNRYKFNSLDDMYASIGFGAMSAGKIISRILEEYRKEHHEENIEAKIEELVQRKPSNKPSKSGVVVKGIDNCLVKLSRCCNPLPGDTIVGYITKGRGVSVHRADCVNVKELVSNENRMIDVYWYQEGKAKYQVDIEVYANDRKGLLADIIRKTEEVKATLIAVSSKANKERVALTELTIEIENLDELNKVIKALRNVDSVFEVKRKNNKV